MACFSFQLLRHTEVLAELKNEQNCLDIVFISTRSIHPDIELLDYDQNGHHILQMGSWSRREAILGRR
jgi:hypothetical protein